MKIAFLVGLVLGYYLILYFILLKTLKAFKVKHLGIFLAVSILFLSIPMFCIYDYLHRGIKVVEAFTVAGYILTGFLIYYVLAVVVVLLIKLIFRRKATYNKITVGVSALISIIVCVIGVVCAQFPDYTQKEIDLALESDLKVLVLSDIHYGSTGSMMSIERMAENVNKENPDLVLLIGDVFDNYTSNLDHERFCKAMNSIKSKYGIFAVTGNHEFMFNTIEEIKVFYEGTNIRLLLDEEVVINNELRIVGRIDEKSELRKDLNTYLSNSTLPLIIMDHQPQYYREAREANALIQISGHTHNGQIFPGDLFLALYNKILYDSPSNGFNYYDNFLLAITRGYGTWGFPMRLTGASQILVFNLK